MKIEVGKKYRARNGEEIHIDGRDGFTQYNLHGVGNFGSESFWNINGKWLGDSQLHDLIEEIEAP